jgi:LmbE family N-acetylglucosaminyl deacetylase
MNIIKNVLIISAHPDDETLGCGGTILKHRENEDNVFWLILTKANQNISPIKNIVNIQKEYIQNIAKAYGFSKTFQMDFLTTTLDTIPLGKLISSISKVISEVQPNIVYLPNRSDIHSDHQTAFKAAISCTKNFRFPFIQRILMYETLSETEFAPVLPESYFLPNYFVDITSYLNKKLEIMQLFTTEKMEELYPRSITTIKALARYRGSRIGTKYAEAFMLLFMQC